MKKIISLLLGVLLLTPALSFAQTTSLSDSQRTALIAALYQELQILEQQIQQILSLQASQGSQQIAGSTQVGQPANQTMDQTTQPPATCVPSLSLADNSQNGHPGFTATYTTGCALDMTTPISFTATANGVQLGSGNGTIQWDAYMINNAYKPGCSGVVGGNCGADDGEIKGNTFIWYPQNSSSISATTSPVTFTVTVGGTTQTLVTQ